jgi:hypothetical protein
LSGMAEFVHIASGLSPNPSGRHPQHSWPKRTLAGLSPYAEAHTYLADL